MNEAFDDLESPLVHVLGMGGIGVWTWNLVTDTVACAVPETGIFEATDVAFASCERFVQLALSEDQPALAKALRDAAAGASAIRHTFRLKTDATGRIRIDAERFGTPSSGRVVGILRSVSGAVADGGLASLLEERDRVARALETALLPPAMPTVAGLSVDAAYKSSEGNATGDFYDFFPVGRGDWGLSIGDVGGHGPAAAAITTSVRYAIRAAALVKRNPTSVLMAANQAHLAAAGSERFTTCHFARLRRSNSGVQVRLATAGHPEILIRRESGTVEQLTGAGPMLGLFGDPEFANTRTKLEVGDILLAHTDGVTEARRGDELFGRHRLANFLRSWSGPVDMIAQTLHITAMAWARRPAQDDMATIALQVDPSIRHIDLRQPGP